MHTMKYYSNIKKNKSLIDAVTWMNRGNVILSEISQTQKDRCSMILAPFLLIFNAMEFGLVGQSSATVV